VDVSCSCQNEIDGVGKKGMEFRVETLGILPRSYKCPRCSLEYDHSLVNAILLYAHIIFVLFYLEQKQLHFLNNLYLLVLSAYHRKSNCCTRC
jgi:hypothetical protein